MILEHFMIEPVQGPELDAFANLFAVVRGVNETDQQLRVRINNLMKHNPGPDNATLQLFLLLEKLGLKKCSEILDTYMPVGHRWR